MKEDTSSKNVEATWKEIIQEIEKKQEFSINQINLINQKTPEDYFQESLYHYSKGLYEGYKEAYSDVIEYLKKLRLRMAPRTITSKLEDMQIALFDIKTEGKTLGRCVTYRVFKEKVLDRLQSERKPENKDISIYTDKWCNILECIKWPITINGVDLSWRTSNVKPSNIIILGCIRHIDENTYSYGHLYVVFDSTSFPKDSDMITDIYYRDFSGWLKNDNNKLNGR